MKKILSLCFSLMLLLILAACSSTIENNPTDSFFNTTITENADSPKTDDEYEISESEKYVVVTDDLTASTTKADDEINDEKLQANESDNLPETEQLSNTEDVPVFENEATLKILIAYFSRAGENYNVGLIEKGNTEIIAEIIAEQTGGDLFHIETVHPYPVEYDACTEAAQQELHDQARPELTASVNNFDDYDVIYLGYPIWWSDMPMAVYTFLESYDFTGKTIVPFDTNEGSGLASTVNSIRNTCVGANVLDGFAIRGSLAQNRQAATDEVVNWLQSADFVE